MERLRFLSVLTYLVFPLAPASVDWERLAALLFYDSPFPIFQLEAEGVPCQLSDGEEAVPVALEKEDPKNGEDVWTRLGI